MELSKIEKNLFKKYNYIAGVDESGMGSLVGPLVTATVILPQGCEGIDGVNDSKKLTPEEREEIFPVIEDLAIAEGTAIIWNWTIDKINNLQSDILGMLNCVSQMNPVPDYILVDGNYGIQKFFPRFNISSKGVVGGDGEILCIACASIIAKTYRDKIMTSLSKEFPNYGWEKNKGYGTKEHFKNIESFGVTRYHRMSYLKRLKKENEEV